MNEDNAIRQGNVEPDDEEVIDLGRLILDMGRGLRRFWAFGLVLVLSFTIVTYVYKKSRWTAKYDAFASLVISNSISSTAQTSSDVSSAKQLGAIFPYIMTSSVLRNVIERELGSFSSNITASAVLNTNLLTIHVTDNDPQKAYDVLQSVLVNYPLVAEYVIGATHFQVIDESGVPAYPSNTADYYKTVVMAGLAAIVLFAGFLVLFALSRKTANAPDDIRQEVGINFLTNVPAQNVRKRSDKTNGVLLVDRNHASSEYVEAFRTMATRADKFMSEAGQGDKKVIAVTSTAPAEGKSTVALNLAILYAHRGKKVILIDGDLRKPSIANTVGIKDVGKNLVELLKGKGTLEETLQRYHRLPMRVLYSVGAGEDTIKLLNSNRMREVIRQCREQADYVIIDTAPIGTVADAASLITMADASIFVIRQDYAQMRDIENTATILREMERPILGFVLNGTLKGGGNYGYGYGYGYGHHYGYGGGYGGYGKYSSNYSSYGAYSKADGLKVDYTSKEMVELGSVKPNAENGARKPETTETNSAQ